MLALVALLLAASPAAAVKRSPQVTAAARAPAIIEDDYPAALAKAKASKKLLFVDAWAPWCHTCVYMREHVLKDPAFAAFEKDLVFASIDTERPGAAPFLEKFSVNVWPTLFFIDPSTETLAFRWAGSADATQMKALLAAARHREGPLAEADALMAKGDTAGASERFARARRDDRATAGDARATLSLLYALAATRQFEVCAQLAADEAGGMTGRSDQLTAVATGLGCALELEPKAAKKAALVSALVTRAKGFIAAPEGLMVDDVSGLYETLVSERSQANDEAGKVATAQAWLAFLDAAAAKATSPAARAVFDAHRTNAALEANEPAHMEAPLLQSEKELPSDYNPAARLALIYRAENKLAEAQAAIERALPKCTGPRKMRLFSIQADILDKRGDAAGRKRSLEAALAYANTLPAVQRPTKQVAALEATLKSLTLK